ncbi:hypothetical protein KCU95_g12971, partial [Aureobasidium melanogenum]
MSNVVSPEEISFFAKWSSKPGFPREGIAVDSHITEEFVKSVLPHGFEPAAELRDSILLSTVDSKLCGEFDCTLVTIDAIFKGIIGKYCLEMLISEDAPVTWGRESDGLRRLEIEWEFGDDLPEESLKGHQFEIKAHTQGCIEER